MSYFDNFDGPENQKNMIFDPIDSPGSLLESYAAFQTIDFLPYPANGQHDSPENGLSLHPEVPNPSNDQAQSLSDPVLRSQTIMTTSYSSSSTTYPVLSATTVTKFDHSPKTKNSSLQPPVNQPPKKTFAKNKSPPSLPRPQGSKKGKVTKSKGSSPSRSPSPPAPAPAPALELGLSLPSSDHIEGLTEKQLKSLGKNVREELDWLKDQRFECDVKVYCHPEPKTGSKQYVALFHAKKNQRITTDNQNLKRLGGVERRTKVDGKELIHVVLDYEYMRAYFNCLANIKRRLEEVLDTNF